MRRKWTAGAFAAVALGVAAAFGVASRGGDAQREPQFKPPAASQQFGDDADLMRRLERKKLTTRTTK